jgi:molybdate transport system ATP-binding protein
MKAGAIQAAFVGCVGGFRLNISFDIPARGVSALFGPSGCGKTLVLRCMAGLQRFDRGTCIIDGDIWQDATSFRPTYERPVGYVFQEASLFPHLSVRRNLFYGFRKSHPVGNQAKVSVDEIIDLLGLEGLLERSPRHLSGGERQRVAIGRALMSSPKLLLMDEPLSALDRSTRLDILPFFERLHERLSLPILYVSHDMTEVEQLADHLVLMEAGQVVAAGSLSQVQSDPSLPLWKSRDAAVSYDAVARDYDATYGLLSLSVDGGTLVVPSPALAVGQIRRLRVSAADVSLALERPSGSTITNILPARILAATVSSDHEVTALLGLGPQGIGARLLARVTRRSWDHLHLREQLNVYAQVKSVALVAVKSTA